MALIRCRVTPLPVACNRAKALKSAGPHAARVKAQRVRKFRLSIAAYPQPALRTRAARREGENLNNPFFALGAVK